MSVPTTLSVLLVAGLAASAGLVRGASRQGEVAALVEPGAPAATLRFELRDALGELVAGRLTFVADDGERDLFTRTDAAPLDMAVRKNVVNSLSGRGAITVPPGRYEIWASRGLEWSTARRALDLAEGDEAQWTATLHHEIDTTGWISADFHLHTLTHSGHGDANLEERIITLVAEGVELAVATDHNHNTDYGPTIEALGAQRELTAVTGNEVSVPIGHFNAFPLEPDRPIPPTDARDAGTLFRLLHDEPNRYGVTPIVQLNHPRWLGIDYFNQTGLDPVSGVSTDAAWSADFDTIEVFNAPEGWGYYDADVVDIPVGSSVHWVLGDWYMLLNRGHRTTAVGNSDSHTVHFEFAGYPRNYVPSATDDPAAIDVAEVVGELRRQRAFTTSGPFVEARIGGEPLGGMARASDGAVRLELRIQAASWIDCDRVVPIYNGQALEPIPVPDTRRIERLVADVELAVPRDGWICLRVEGDDSLAPIVDGGQRPVLPLAVTNPVWIDADGDGEWTSPWKQALSAVDEHDSAVSLRRTVASQLLPPEHALVLLAAQERARPFLNELVRSALRSDERRVWLAAARIAEDVADRSLRAELESTLGRPGLDVFAQLALLRAAKACGTLDVPARVAELVGQFGSHVFRRYPADLERLAGDGPLGNWMLAGYYPSGGPGNLLETESPPEYERGSAEAVAEPIDWVEAVVSSDGYIDLLQLGEERGEARHSFAYARTWLRSPDQRDVLYALGTDDGCRLWVNGQVAFEDPTHHGASAYQQVGLISLREGWNPVLLKVENGVGGFGFYFRVLDAEIESAVSGSR